MAKKRRTRKQKIQASHRRQNSYSPRTISAEKEHNTSNNVDKNTTKGFNNIEYKSLATSIVIFLMLVMVQLVISWLFVD